MREKKKVQIGGRFHLRQNKEGRLHGLQFKLCRGGGRRKRQHQKPVNGNGNQQRGLVYLRRRGLAFEKRRRTSRSMPGNGKNVDPERKNTGVLEGITDMGGKKGALKLSKTKVSKRRERAITTLAQTRGNRQARVKGPKTGKGEGV